MFLPSSRRPPRALFLPAQCNFRGQLGTTFKLGRVTQQNVGCCEVHVVSVRRVNHRKNGYRTKKEEQEEVKEEYRAGKVWSK